jgi:neurotransmitter:Na+ symporter, NSS family
MAEGRSKWGSKVGFILAASGSAIGLGNIVFFSANAYKFGSGAFYLPYLFALVVVGLPLMLMELALGTHTGKAFPQSMHRVAKRPGEFAGWWGLLNTTIISMYYVAILGWVLGMLIGSLKGLWDTSPVTSGAFGHLGMQNPFGYFFGMLGSWNPVVYVVIVWAINFAVVFRGTRSIEAVTRWIVPVMWVCMLVLIVRGVTLPDGYHGAYLLFNPDLAAMANPDVWRGAFSQIFFTLSLGFGIMTAYASYLPKDSDQVENTSTICFLNCGFEFIAGLAIFSLVFAFSVVPKASTLSMMFFVVPQGIASLPSMVVAFGVLFFFLLFIAGLTSSISLVEAFVAALIDKFGWKRTSSLAFVVIACLGGSIAFALPHVVDPTLSSNGTLGLSLLDLLDHWAFSYGLMITGLVECVLVGWVFGASKLRAIINDHSAVTVGRLWEVLIKFVIPLILAALLLLAVVGEFRDGLYGDGMKVGEVDWLHWAGLGAWLLFTVGGGLLLTYGRKYRSEEADA